METMKEEPAQGNSADSAAAAGGTTQSMMVKAIDSGDGRSKDFFRREVVKVLMEVVTRIG
ncbi:unnamed protein product [Arabis nemorensis]|uniref:Uncharacterized protein n=1 Tax=Arabis nemorensis TaxID=586526 RepID=A0A565AVQ9_9BRAS|nr:unnamed protein product [Arabis nemorensis]